MKERWAMMMAAAVLLGATARTAAAADHVVSLSELRQEADGAARTRDRNMADVQRVLSLPAAQDAIRQARINTTQMNGAIAQLDDQELARLADRARAAEKDVEGGLIVGILALIGLIVVIIIVVSVVS